MKKKKSKQYCPCCYRADERQRQSFIFLGYKYIFSRTAGLKGRKRLRAFRDAVDEVDAQYRIFLGLDLA